MITERSSEMNDFEYNPKESNLAHYMNKKSA